MTKCTGIAALDDKASLWQANWVFHSIMPGSHLTTAGDKPWLNIMCQDVSGRVEARMNQKTALEVSGRSNKEEFLQALADGDAVFPTILSLKLSRTIKAQPETDTGEKQTSVNTAVLAACAQEMTMSRTTSVMQLVPIMRSLTTMSTAILPAALNMLRPTDLQAQPCHKVWVPISHKKVKVHR